MSREYDMTCPKCNEYNARILHINDNVELLQCLNKECGTCFKIVQVYTELKTKGTTESAWQKATKEAQSKGQEKE